VEEEWARPWALRKWKVVGMDSVNERVVGMDSVNERVVGMEDWIRYYSKWEL